MTMYELAVYGLDIPEVDELECYEVPEEMNLSIIELEKDGE